MTSNRSHCHILLQQFNPTVSRKCFKTDKDALSPAKKIPNVSFWALRRFFGSKQPNAFPLIHKWKWNRQNRMTPASVSQWPWMHKDYLESHHWIHPKLKCNQFSLKNEVWTIEPGLLITVWVPGWVGRLISGTVICVGGWHPLAD